MKSLRESLSVIDLNKIPQSKSAYSFVKRCQFLDYEPSEKQQKFLNFVLGNKDWFKDDPEPVQSHSGSKEFDKLYIRVLALYKSMGDLEPTEIVNRLKNITIALRDYDSWLEETGGFE